MPQRVKESCVIAMFRSLQCKGELVMRGMGAYVDGHKKLLTQRREGAKKNRKEEFGSLRLPLWLCVFARVSSLGFH
jgi:hypothetical protein